MSQPSPRTHHWQRDTGVRARFVVVGTALGLLVILNFAVLLQPASAANWRCAVDWGVMTSAANAVAAGKSPFVTTSWGATFHWSPIAAWLLVPITTLGLSIWRLAHFAAILALGDRRLIAITLLSWPFWYDVELGNLLTFGFVLAVLAIRGSRWATLGYLALCLLVPRPLMAPVALWLLWQRPWVRGPFLVAGLAQIVILAAIGQLGPFLAALLAISGDVANATNVGPSRLVGSAWLIVGLPLAAWFTLRGRLGLASLAVSPYWLPYYFLFGLLELSPPRLGRSELPTNMPGGTGSCGTPGEAQRSGGELSARATGTGEPSDSP